MKIKENGIYAPFRSEIVERPWGSYGLYADNEPCTTKILYIRRGETLSLQYHFKRDQFYLLLDDGFVIDYSSKEVPLDLINEPNEDTRIKGFNKFLEENMIRENGQDGDRFGFMRRIIHRAGYVGEKPYGKILDVAFGNNDEEDIVRIEDKYGRDS